MASAAVIGEAGLREMLGRALERTRLMAPVKRGRTAFDFRWVEDPAEVELDYVRTVLPPKKALLPPRERLLEFRRLPDQEPKGMIEEEPFALVGVHPCDLAAIGQLDWAMGRRHGIGDPHYLARRRAVTIIGVECMPDEYCFCSSVDTCGTRAGADLFLTPVDGGYFAEVLTPKGEGLLAEARGVREATEEEAARAAGWVAEKVRRTKCRIEAETEELAELLGSRYESEIWERTAERCYSCGTCTTVCPTCFCFDVDDEVNFPLETGARGRTYDSCQFLDFAVVAGGHNFRGERVDRVRHRWFRKFVYLLREHGRPFCVGCGRCSQACTAGISLVDVINAAASEAREGVAP
jgi:sulfhydrogenase subunit beta (sulfur reductase)